MKILLTFLILFSHCVLPELDCGIMLNNIENNVMIQLMKNELSELDSIVDNKERYLAYKTILNNYSNYHNVNNIYDCFTEEEILYMQRCIETETFEADFEAKVHVACVILNRIYSEKFPNDAIEVVTQPNQFAYFRTDITEDTVLALEYAYLNDTTKGALFFHSYEKTDTFNGASYIFTDHVGHHFY